MLNCIDNSGAAVVECAMVIGLKRHARIGTDPPLRPGAPFSITPRSSLEALDNV